MLYRTCKLGTGTLIGSSTQIQENTQIYSSVIGQRCTIGLGTVISNSYIFDNAHIGSNCVIERSIIGSNVHIKDNTNVPRGCLIADSVVIGPCAKLEPFDRLSARREGFDGEADDDEEYDSDLEEVEASCVFQRFVVNIFLYIIQHKVLLTNLGSELTQTHSCGLMDLWVRMRMRKVLKTRKTCVSCV